MRRHCSPPCHLAGLATPCCTRTVATSTQSVRRERGCARCSPSGVVFRAMRQAPRASRAALRCDACGRTRTRGAGERWLRAQPVDQPSRAAACSSPCCSGSRRSRCRKSAHAHERARRGRPRASDCACSTSAWLSSRPRAPARMPEFNVLWLNDVYKHAAGRQTRPASREVGGILCTSAIAGDVVDLLLGCGVDVDNDEPSTSLATAALGRDCDAAHRDRHVRRHGRAPRQVLRSLRPLRLCSAQALYHERWLHSGQRVSVAGRPDDVFGWRAGRRRRASCALSEDGEASGAAGMDANAGIVPPAPPCAADRAPAAGLQQLRHDAAAAE